MGWGSFFNYRKLKIGGSVTAVAAASGIAATYSLASDADNFCSNIVTSFIHQIIENITIPELTTTVHYGDFNATVTLEDTTVIVPPTWVHLVNETPGVDPLCYKIVFILGVCVTLCLSLALGAFVNTIIRDTDEPKPNIVELESTAGGANESASEHDDLLAPASM